MLVRYWWFNFQKKLCLLAKESAFCNYRNGMEKGMLMGNILNNLSSHLVCCPFAFQILQNFFVACQIRRTHSTPSSMQTESGCQHGLQAGGRAGERRLQCTGGSKRATWNGTCALVAGCARWLQVCCACTDRSNRHRRKVAPRHHPIH